MTEDEIQRHKDRADWSTEEIVANKLTGAIPESDQYRTARAEALEAAGLTEDEPTQEPDGPTLVETDNPMFPEGEDDDAPTPRD